MQLGKLAALAFGIGLLSGCAGMRLYPADTPETPCPDATCTVNVSVTFTITPKFTCNITVEPQALKMTGSLPKQTIKWTLTGASWPKDVELPIKFYANAQKVMSPPVTSGNSVSVTYTRPNSGGNHYEYAVYVLTEVKSICNTDPWVVD